MLSFSWLGMLLLGVDLQVAPAAFPPVPEPQGIMAPAPIIRAQAPGESLSLPQTIPQAVLPQTAAPQTPVPTPVAPPTALFPQTTPVPSVMPATIGSVAPQSCSPFGYLCASAYALDHEFRTPIEAYHPQPGDILFFCDDSILWGVLYRVALTGPPYHTAIVIRKPDGTLGAFEAGPNDTLWCEITNFPNRLHDWKKRLWVRRRSKPLTDEESRRLTEFASKQEGKFYALIRLGGQLTPLRHRGPLRTYFLGKPKGPDRWAYWCAEAVLEACVYAGLLNPETTRPSATYPRDMFFDRSTNLYLDRHFRLAPDWLPPQRWLPSPRPPAVTK